MKRDTLYASPASSARFEFDERVAGVFDDMVARSVPGYAASLELIAALAPSFLTTEPRLGYDLGCALGESSRAMLAAVEEQECRVIAVDNAAPMLQRMQERMQARGERRVSSIEADMREFALQPASLIVLHLALQFIAPNQRDGLLQRCAAALAPDGALLLFEKTTAPPQIETAHQQFKANNGYSRLEITQKRQALEEVLVAESREQHEARLAACGFGRVTCVFTALNFHGWLAQP